MKKCMVLVAAMMMIAGMVSAQEVEGFESAEIADTLIANVDTIEVDPDPEWYVAPLNYDSVMARRNAPRRAAAANNCPIDSVRTFNVDSMLERVTVYEYGDTTRTMVWTVNPDGSRYGSSRTEEGTNGNITFSATYAWDAVAGDWKGTSKEEHTFTGSKETLCTLYDWQNGAWSAETQYTWVFDAAGRETEYTTYQRNNAGALAYSKQRIREYNTAGKTTLDIQYTAHNGATWSAGTKELWEYNPSNLQTLHEKYTLANSDWTITLREIKGYDAANNNDLIENYALQSNVWKGTKKEEYVFNSAKKKTSSIVYAWSNGAWVGNTKELWEYNAANTQTLHEKYSWSNEDWAISLQENSGYDEAGNNILIENYSYTNGVQKGTKKEEYTFNAAKKKTNTYKYKWVTASATWEYNTWAVSGYDAAGNANETANYKWTNDAWVGTGNRVLKTYNTSKKITGQITQTWSADMAAWINATRDTTIYEGAKTTREASYAWSAENNDWVGTSRSDWHYNAAGLNDTIKTYTNNGTDWIYSDRTAKTYNAAGTEIMVHNAHWNGAAWVMTSMTRTDISDVTVDGIRQTLNATWRCDADSVWIGVQKDTAVYSATGKQLFVANYASWSGDDWIPSYKIEYEYDEADHMILNQRLNWSIDRWIGAFRYQYLYDSADRQIMLSQYIWSNNNWYGFSKTEIAYYATGKQQSSISFSWVNNDWTPNQKTEYVYDTQGRTIDRKIFHYSNGTWKNNQWKRFSYDSHDNEVLNRDYRWVNDEWLMISQNDYIYDLSDNKLRRETVGSWSSSGVLYSYYDNHYYYACDPHLYTIRFCNENGTLLESKQVNKGEVPSYTGGTPTKQADAQYTYSFKGWTPAIVAVTGDAVYTAEYDSVLNRYRITWLNADSTLIAVDSLEYGATPSHEEVKKTNTAEWTYSFEGWSPVIATVTKDATYKAQLDSVRNTYRVTFKNGADTLQSTMLAYGAMPEYNGDEPSKQGDAQYSYTFNGWDAELVSVTGEATYNATFNSTVNNYLVTFKNGQDTLQSTPVAYGSMPEYTGAEPTKQADAQYTYSFNGWDTELVVATGEATYNATFNSTVNNYLVTFKNGTDTLQSTMLAYGAMPVYGGETPTKQGDAQYSYTFSGWDAELAAVTGEATYNAMFSSTVNTYPVTFKNGDDILQSTQVAYGSMPEYTGNEPTKQADAQYTYSFNGWDAELVSVTGEATYNATFSSTINNYRITFKNGVDTLQSTLVAYGTMPVYGGETPTKQADAQYTYSFNGWDAELVEVTGETTYNATFSSTVNNYTITWLLDDGTKIDEQSVAYGTTPSHTDAHKDNTAQYTITFVGWDKEFAAVTGDETYTAVFDSVVNRYTVIFYFEDGVTVLDSKEWKYGETPSTSLIPSLPATPKYTYTFAGWSPELQPVTGNASYSPVFDSIVNTYTVTFVNYNNMVLQSSQVPYDDVPEYTGETPTKPSSYKYHYVFIGWTPDIVAVTGDARYEAEFEQVLNSYTILFYDEDGLTVLDSVEVEYGQMPETSVVPTKEDDEEYTYTFAGWSPKIVTATKNTSYTATYTAKLKTEGLWDVEAAEKAQKVMIDGVIYIRRGGKIYTLDGTEVE